MKRENLILCGPLRYAKSTGVLLTKEAVRAAEKELSDGLRDWFEEHRIRRLKTLEVARRIVLD